VNCPPPGPIVPTFGAAEPLVPGRGKTAGRRESPLGKGYLTGKINESTGFDSSDFRNTLPRCTPEARKADQALVDLLGKVAQRKKATPAQIALAWLLAQKPWIVPIRGTTKLHRLDGNSGAAAVELTSDDLNEIVSAASRITVQGARYPEQLRSQRAEAQDARTGRQGHPAGANFGDPSTLTELCQRRSPSHSRGHRCADSRQRCSSLRS